MKKTVFTFILSFAFLANVSAQVKALMPHFKINASGQVGIGTPNPQYTLQIGGER